MFPELRAEQIEVPRDVLEMREGNGEAPAHKAGASVSSVWGHSRGGSSELTSAFPPHNVGLLRDGAATRRL